MAFFSILMSDRPFTVPRPTLALLEHASARKGAEAPFFDISNLSVPPSLLISPYRRRPQRERLNRCTHCLRLTRSTEVRSIAQTTITTSQNTLRVSVLRKITLRVLRVSPRARAQASLYPFSRHRVSTSYCLTSTLSSV